MRVLIYSLYFSPSVGGAEVTSKTLADRLTQLGHECVVITQTRADDGMRHPFKVLRSPSLIAIWERVKWCDLIYCAGATMKIVPFGLLARKPIVWRHVGYQVAGLNCGWSNGRPSPTTLWASLFYHFNKMSPIRWVGECIKVGLRRICAHCVTLNICNSEWTAKIIRLKNQVVAYPPFPLEHFRSCPRNRAKKYDFIFIGRLTDEKGVADLLRAMALLLRDDKFKSKKLVIVGSGPLEEMLRKESTTLALDGNVTFAGMKRGQELLDILAESEIGIVPSAYEESFGGVALELMAAGKNVIVSERGGLKESVADAGLTFPNGDAQVLSRCMQRLVEDPLLAEEQRRKAVERIRLFDEIVLTQRYLELFEAILRDRS